MGWGTELWDRLEAVEGHTAEGIAFITHVRTLAAKVRHVATTLLLAFVWEVERVDALLLAWQRTKRMRNRRTEEHGEERQMQSMSSIKTIKESRAPQYKKETQKCADKERENEPQR